MSHPGESRSVGAIILLAADHAKETGVKYQDTKGDKPAGLLLEAGSRVPAPVYFEQSTRLLKV